MGKWTNDFAVEEFACTCGQCKNSNRTNPLVATRMQELHDYLKCTKRGCSKIIITSGYRCNYACDNITGAFRGDAHNAGIACDFIAYDKDGNLYDAYSLAAVAELIGFGGVAIIDNTAVHVDCRDSLEYYDKYGNRLFKWYGNEMTGNDYITTFNEYLPPLVKPLTDLKKSNDNIVEKSFEFDGYEIKITIRRK